MPSKIGGPFLSRAEGNIELVITGRLIAAMRRGACTARDIDLRDRSEK
jgi:hypothetical protein